MTKDIKQFAIDLAKTQADYYRQLNKVDHKDLGSWFYDQEQQAWEQHHCDQIAEAFSHLDRKWRWPR
jgi:hypothetical protein|tara:strand:+ start:292 stop:492 length:201 start_codon:yes stop_codon:yes gene_type:complete